MTEAENVFQIWDRVGRIVPFAVRRANWSQHYYTVVERIDCDNLPYGKAFGYPTENGQYSTHYEYDNKWRKEQLIPNAGSYQWFLVSNADLSTYRNALPATEPGSKNVFNITSRVFFGKYKDQNVLDIFKTDPGYVDWAIKNISNFVLTNAAFQYLNQYRVDFTFSEEAKQAQFTKLSKFNL